MSQKIMGIFFLQLLFAVSNAILSIKNFKERRYKLLILSMVVTLISFIGTIHAFVKLK